MVCFDTTFIVDLLRGSKNVQLLVKQLDSGSETISAASPSIIEIVRGLKVGNVRESEIEKVNALISSLNVLSLDKESAILAGNIEADLINSGEIIELVDIMIAAIAINNNEVLITRDKKHFSRIKNLMIQDY